ncbi:uncharacterized protein LOC129612991 [Condylostylus longicornis]|uniref:uncharacterized protein LOC129612991 n=1 Tax=Condylostylus longicornis TaxID=2530218 RepID=UPI00244E1188|nr:uncharacterized protein LOC129612991 [Condylostylus longicornis]
MSNPSLAYEVLIYLNSFYFGMFASCELSIGLLKAINLRYENHSLAKESTLLVAFCILETIRIVLGRRGALADRDWRVILSCILILPSIAEVIFLLFFQTYTLKLEYVLSSLMLALLFVEVWFCIMFIFTTCRPVTYD